MIYLAGSLRNPRVPEVAEILREDGHFVFDQWYSAGPEADDYLRDYFRARGFTYQEALQSPVARHIFDFDVSWIDKCDTFVLLMPAGKSGHLEAAYAASQDKSTYVLFEEEPERYDIMYNFLDEVFTDIDSLREALK